MVQKPPGKDVPRLRWRPVGWPIMAAGSIASGGFARMAANYLSGPVTMYRGAFCSAASQIQARGFRQSLDGMLGREAYLSREINKAKQSTGEKCWQKGFDTSWVPLECCMVAWRKHVYMTLHSFCFVFQTVTA